MNAEEMEARITAMEAQLRRFQDLDEIKQLQRIYGYYLEHWMSHEIIDLFADGPGVHIHFPEGKYAGKEGVRRYFESMNEKDPELLHQLMQLSPVVDVDPDGKTARGRWYSFGALAIPLGGGISQSWGSGVYENEYVKEDGKWKFKVLKWVPCYNARPGTGWVAPERVAAIAPDAKFTIPEPDYPPEGPNYNYPSGYVFPFHFKHPVTGEQGGDEKRNEYIRRLKEKS